LDFYLSGVRMTNLPTPLLGLFFPSWARGVGLALVFDLVL
jgi:hypothetical protein